MVILAAVDRSERAPFVVAESAKLAKAFDDELHVLHVMSRAEFVKLQTDSVDKTGDPIDMGRIRGYAAEVADDAAEGIDMPYETVSLVGKAEDEILRYIEEHAVRYVVLGPRRRSPVGKAVFGSVAQEILLNADCPVVTIQSEA